MQFADLTDTSFKFTCDFEGDAVDYWDYSFSAIYKDQQYNRTMTRDELEELRANCKRILSATGFDGVY